MKKILIIKTSSLGDIIHTFHVIDSIKTLYPEVSIDWVVEAPFAELIQSHPHVTRTLCVSTKQWRKNVFSRNTYKQVGSFIKELQQVTYDVAFDLQGNTKSGIILSQVKSKQKVGFSRKAVPEWPNLLFTNVKVDISPNQNIRMDYINVVSGFFKGHKSISGKSSSLQIAPNQKKAIDDIMKDRRIASTPRFMVCPGSAWKNKQLDPIALKRFLSLVHEGYDCSFLFVWGSPEEHLFANELAACFPLDSLVVDKLKVPMLQGLMQRCDLIISVDSLALHLAGTTDTPTFAVFGPSSAEKYNPIGNKHSFYQGTCPYGRTFDKRCPVLRTCKTGACIRAITGEELYAAFISRFH